MRSAYVLEITYIFYILSGTKPKTCIFTCDLIISRKVKNVNTLRRINLIHKFVGFA